MTLESASASRQFALGGRHADPLPIETSPTSNAVRSQGSLAIEFRHRPSGTFVARDYQSGCLRARRLRSGIGSSLQIATINTAGGLTGGDDVRQSFAWGRNTRAVVTTPTAEKIYRADGGTTRIRTEISVAKGAHAEWLPQETILFAGSRLDRALTIRLTSGSSLIAYESLVFGRLARGEKLRANALSDLVRIYLDDKLVMFDRVLQDGDFECWLDGLSTARACRAVGTILVVVPADNRLLAAIRDAARDASGMVATTCVRGIIIVRLLSPDDRALRHDAALVLSVIRSDQPLPRSWSC